MKKEFIVERQGKAFVLYAGLLDLAHQSGLSAIRTEIVQIPSEANYRTAIVVCTVVMEKDGVERVFTGIGDAAPNNVAPMMQTALIRMAETRAKARALRDAVNVGVTAFEELGEESAADHARTAPRRATSRQSDNHLRMQDSALVPEGQQCPSCHAPGGKRHAANCKATAVA